MSNYYVEFSVYHGTSRDKAVNIVRFGSEELFFTTEISRAKSYSDEGVVLRKQMKIPFQYLNEAKRCIRKIVMMDFVDFIEKDVKGKNLRMLKFNPSVKHRGKTEEISITDGKRYLYTADNPSPSVGDKRFSPKYFKLHKR